MDKTITSISSLPISLNAEQVGMILGISRSNAYKLMRSKGFPTIHIGKRMLVPRDKLILWMDRQTPLE